MRSFGKAQDRSFGKAQDKHAVLFDWNGTLLNDCAIWYAAVCEIFKQFNKIPPTVEQYFTELKGDYINIYRSRGVETSREELNQIYGEYYKSHMFEAELFPNAYELLKMLFGNGTVVGLITLQDIDFTVPLLEKFDIWHFMRYKFFSCRDKADAIRKIIKAEGVSPENCFFVGDAPADIAHAKSAGVRSVGFFNGFTPEWLLKEAAPDFAVSSLAEILYL